MIRRLISVIFVLVTLLFAGLPQVACASAVPGHACCPTGSSAPCDLDVATLTPQDTTQPCCAENVTGSIAVAADDSSGELHKMPNRVYVPTLAVTSVVLPSVYLAGLKFQKSSTPYSLNPSSALLYLSTGRLRL